jgi:hypothetical protein
MAELYRDANHECWLLLIDVFWAHRAPEFISWLKTNFKTAILLFVPANCTPVLQPLDVHFNAYWKQYIGKLCVSWLMLQVVG